MICKQWFSFTGLKTTIHGGNVAEFWRHQRTITNGLCVLTVNAMMLRHPNKNCNRCGGGLFGRFHACRSCRFHFCTSCVESTVPECPTHGAEFVNEELVPLPLHIFEQKHREYAHERRQHQRYLERQRVRALAFNLSQAH